jgi:hypothetical protein
MMGRGARVLGCLALVWASSARAQSAEEAGPLGSGVDAHRLEWRAPPGCPTREEVLAQVAVLAASEDLSWGRFERIRATVEAERSGFRLVVEFVGSDGVRGREMKSPRCSDLATAAAVVIVLAYRGSGRGGVDPEAARPDDLGSEPPGPARERPVPPLAGGDEASSPAESAAAADAGPAAALLLHVEAALDPTTLGGAAFGATLGVDVRLGVISAVGYGTFFPSVTTSLDGDQGIALGLWTSGVRGCARWGRGLDTCALLELGQLEAHGVALSRSGRARDVWVAPGLAMGFTSMPFGGFGITAQLAGFLPLVRGRFRVDENDAHRIPAIGFRASVGVEIPLL